MRNIAITASFMTNICRKPLFNSHILLFYVETMHTRQYSYIILIWWTVLACTSDLVGPRDGPFTDFIFSYSGDHIPVLSYYDSFHRRFFGTKLVLSISGTGIGRFAVFLQRSFFWNGWKLSTTPFFGQYVVCYGITVLRRLLCLKCAETPFSFSYYSNLCRND